MSYTFQYNPEPGIVSDVIKLFTIKFTPKSIWTSVYTLTDSFDSDLKRIEKFANHFTADYSKLLLFSYKMPHRSATYLSSIFTNQLLTNYQDFSFDSFLSYFKDKAQVRNDILSYYLGDQDYSYTNVEALIRKNDSIPDKIKILLLGFLLDTSTYLRHLTVQMKSYYSGLCDYHFSPSTDFKLTESIVNSLIETWCKNPSKVKSEIANTTIHYSFCFAIPNYLFHCFTPACSWLIFTPDSLTRIKPLSKPTTSRSLAEISRSIGEPHRVTILQLLFSNDFMSMQDLITHTNCSRSTLHHHLTILENARLITSQYRGSKKIYAYNPDGFKNVSDIFLKISKGEFKQ